MFVAALIVLIIAVLLVIAALFGGSDATSIDMGAFEVEGPASLVFFAGMGTLLLFVLSLGMFRSAVKRAAARRADRRKVSELDRPRSWTPTSGTSGRQDLARRALTSAAAANGCRPRASSNACDGTSGVPAEARAQRAVR